MVVTQSKRPVASSASSINNFKDEVTSPGEVHTKEISASAEKISDFSQKERSYSKRKAVKKRKKLADGAIGDGSDLPGRAESYVEAVEMKRTVKKKGSKEANDEPTGNKRARGAKADLQRHTERDMLPKLWNSQEALKKHGSYSELLSLFSHCSLFVLRLMKEIIQIFKLMVQN